MDWFTSALVGHKCIADRTCFAALDPHVVSHACWSTDDKKGTIIVGRISVLSSTGFTGSMVAINRYRCSRVFSTLIAAHASARGRRRDQVDRLTGQDMRHSSGMSDSVGCLDIRSKKKVK
jgi:hypothetical protein